MPSPSAIDSTELTSLALPFEPNQGYLSEKPCLVDGSDCYTTWGGTLKKRPPIKAFGPILRRDTGAQMAMYAARLWIYRTLDPIPFVYVVGSFYNTTTTAFELWWAEISYNNVSDVTDWIKAENYSYNLGSPLLIQNLSQYPHEALIKRGKLFVKSFPSVQTQVTSADTPGAVLPNYILDGTGGNITVHRWGALGPTTATALTNPAGWSAAANAITVRLGWIYTYTWVKESGQETNHAPLETNPDKSPSATGPFTNKIPAMTGEAPFNNAEFPFINMYRTTDGGGTFFFLKQIPNNTTDGTFSFSDTYQESGAGGGVFSDPLADANLDTQQVSPTTQSNSPPPTVTPPLVTGVDPPQRCTRMVEHSGRIWFGIQDYLFYSALEELNAGVPEESFPSGVALPNFFRVPSHIAHLISTPSGLLVTLQTGQTLRINGTAKATFNPQPFLGGIGGNGSHRDAATEAREYAAWLTQDYRVAIAQGESYAVISNPLGAHFRVESEANADLQFVFWTQDDKEWLIIGALNAADTTASHWHIYDFQWAERVKSDFWYPEWDIKCTAITSGQSSVTATDNKLFAAMWDGTKMQLGILDHQFAGTIADLNPTTQAQDDTYGIDFTLALQQVPAGDHVNERIRPDASWPAKNLAYERTVFGTAGEADAAASVYYDDFFTTPVSLKPPSPPPRRAQSIGYKTVIHNDVLRVCKHIAVRLTWPDGAWQVEVHQLYVGWQPGAGD